jgi:nucleoside triphosphate pyrophosphatase
LAALVLASASPRRAQILRALGVDFRVVVSGADEHLEPAEDAAAAAERLARLKAASVARVEAPPILGADTVVVCEGRILGKPDSTDEAREMLRLLSGRMHEVVTGLCLITSRATLSGVERTAVAFARMSAEEIDWYVATGEPMDKAGGYHVDGRGALFVSAVTGSPSNVAGLPVPLFRRLVRDAGLDVALPRR